MRHEEMPVLADVCRLLQLKLKLGIHLSFDRNLERRLQPIEPVMQNLQSVFVQVIDGFWVCSLETQMN